MKSGIYKIAHIGSGRAYVGSSARIDRRWQCHLSSLSKGKHHSRRLQKAWNMHGRVAFEFTILEIVDRESLIAREQFWIDELRAWHDGYNIMPKAGSQIGRIVTDEARLNMSLAQSRAPRSAEVRAKIGATQKGKPRNPVSIAKMAATKKGMRLSAETIARMSAARTGKKLSPAAIAKRTATRSGLRHTAAAKAKMSATRKGRPLASETKAKMSEAHIGRPKSAETRVRMTDAQRALAAERRQSGNVWRPSLAMIQGARRVHLGVKKSPEAIAKRTATRARNRQAGLDGNGQAASQAP